MSEEENFVRYETRSEGAVALITLSRAQARNAQNKQMTYQLNDAFSQAAHDDAVHCIVLAADGPDFSSGHDLKGPGQFDADPHWVGGSWTRPGAEGLMAMEEEMYLHMCRRWHDLPKPTIAAVQGKVIAGGLMLMWVCDLIVCADDAQFRDMTVDFGVNGVEWFCHPWEMGIRKAKEFLFTGDWFSAEDAADSGMVNRVVPAADLLNEALALAERIASRPQFALKLAKLSVNQALDAQGFQMAQQAAFSLQHLGHEHVRAEMIRQGLTFPGE